MTFGHVAAAGTNMEKSGDLIIEHSLEYFLSSFRNYVLNVDFKCLIVFGLPEKPSDFIYSQSKL